MLNKVFSAVKNWWLLLIIGIISIVCGFIIVGRPGAGYEAISIFLVIQLIAVGIIGIIYIISNRAVIPVWGLQLVLPILLLIFGIIIACNFGMKEVFLYCFFAAGVLLKGIETITYAISLSKIPGSGWGWTLAGGIIIVIASGFIFANPLFSAVFIGYFVGFTLVFVGIDAIVVSIQLSKVKSLAKAAAKEVEAAVKDAQ